jgi:hypothetical protein
MAQFVVVFAAGAGGLETIADGRHWSRRPSVADASVSEAAASIVDESLGRSAQQSPMDCRVRYLACTGSRGPDGLMLGILWMEWDETVTSVTHRSEAMKQMSTQVALCTE